MEYKNVIKIIISNCIILAMKIVTYIGIEQASEIMTSIIGLLLNNKF